MPLQKDNLFFSNVIAVLDAEADDDRKLLVQEQKACRIRARQYSRETNRRRKMMEDRKRQQDIQEKRRRENILQQRKQRLQEDTERFQRAHLPPSLKRRPAFCKRVPNLDEALHYIQGDRTCYTHHASFSPVTSTISRSTPSSKPPGGSSGPRNLYAVSATQAYDKLTQERSLGDFKTSQLLFSNQLQENLPKYQEQLRIQEHSDTQISDTESLSSLDSLENEVPQHCHGNKPDSLDPPEVHDTRRPASLQRQLNCPSPSSNHCPPKSFLEKVISQQGLPSSSRSSSTSPVEDESANEAQSVQNLLKTAEHFYITGQFHTSNVQATFSCQKQVLATNSVHREYQYGTTSQENISRDKSTISVHCKMQTAPGTLPLEYSSMAQQSNSGEFSKCAKHPSEMHAAQKASRNVYGSASDLNKVSPSLENSALQTVEAKKSFLSTKRKPDGDGVLVLERRTQLGSFDKYKNAERPNLADENSDSRLAEAILPKSSKMTEEPDKTSMDTLANHTDLKSNNVRFLKGILKKKLKCMEDGDAKFMYTTGNFSFRKQVVLAIRDSLELIQCKSRDPESNKCIQKQLRWFDEVNGNGGENKEIVTKELSKQAESESRLTQPPQQPLLDQQHGSWCMNIPSGILKNNKTSSGPADPNSTKQAWSDVGPQKGKQQEPTGESRMKKAASCTTGQGYSGRTGSGITSFQTRRGTMIRPQSSSQVQHIVRTQGKVLVPRPPPRSEVTGWNSGQAMMYITKTCNNDERSPDKAHLAVEQVLYKDYPEGQPVPQCHILKTDEGTILAPVSKGIYTQCQSDSQIRRGSNGFRKCILDHTPTDEEISLLWRGVRSALANKDGDSGSLQTHNGLLSALPQTHANLSHITINGDVSGVEAVARMGSFFLSSSNVRSLVRRPILENNMVKNRTAALGYKKPPVLHQATVPITARKTDQRVPDQGSEVMGGDKKVAVDLAQFQRDAESLQSQRGLTALSLEEQKLLQSLDRLNHRLQHVQDVAAGNTALRGIVALDSTNNQFPQPGKRSCATLHKYPGRRY